MNSVRTTHVACSAGDFPLHQAGMIMKWSHQFHLNKKGNQSNRKEKNTVAVLENLIAYFAIL